MAIPSAASSLRLSPKLIMAVGMLLGPTSFASSAQGSRITWELQFVQFDDGAAAAGSSMYDLDANVYGGANIITSGGSQPSASYDFVDDTS
jgi:hypothetical protein